MILSGAGIGFSRSRELVQQEKNLELFYRMVLLLKGEIRYGNASLHDAFTGAAAKLPGAYRAFLEAAAAEIAKKQTGSLEDIFSLCAEHYLKNTGLKKEELERMNTLGRYLGYLDLEMQLKQLELLCEELEQERIRLRASLPEKKKLYNSLGILLGILLAVLVW